MIGLPVCLDTRGRWRAGLDYFYLKRDYARLVARHGAVPFLLTPEVPPEDALALCDAFIFVGGDDLSPSLYGEAAQPEVVEEEAGRTSYEWALLDSLGRQSHPVLGICYGAQLINVHRGGSLHQYLPREPGTRAHGGRGRIAGHAVRVSSPSRLEGILGPEVQVASCHVQAVARLGSGLAVAATAPDGVVEAVESTDGRWIGVQWHPEADATGDLLMKALLAKIRSTPEGQER